MRRALEPEMRRGEPLAHRNKPALSKPCKSKVTSKRERRTRHSVFKSEGMRVLRSFHNSVSSRFGRPRTALTDFVCTAHEISALG